MRVTHRGSHRETQQDDATCFQRVTQLIEPRDPYVRIGCSLVQVTYWRMFAKPISDPLMTYYQWNSWKHFLKFNDTAFSMKCIWIFLSVKSRTLFRPQRIGYLTARWPSDAIWRQQSGSALDMAIPEPKFAVAYVRHQAAVGQIV